MCILFVKGITALLPELEVSGDVNEYRLAVDEFLIRDDFSGSVTVTVSAAVSGTYTISGLG